jgi:hypothetical protein
LYISGDLVGMHELFVTGDVGMPELILVWPLLILVWLLGARIPESLPIVLFYVLFACKCVLYNYHRVSTQLQLTNISISKYYCRRCWNSRDTYYWRWNARVTYYWGRCWNARISHQMSSQWRYKNKVTATFELRGIWHRGYLMTLRWSLPACGIHIFTFIYNSLPINFFNSVTLVCVYSPHVPCTLYF